MIDSKNDYLHFEELSNPHGKTKIFEVSSVQNKQVLGIVKWWSHWRKYTFWPGPGIIFDPNCLRCIADIMEIETKKQKQEKK